MFVINLDPAGVGLYNDTLVLDSNVQVVKDDLCGLEGKLVSEANKMYVMIRIAGILNGSAKVSKSYLRTIP